MKILIKTLSIIMSLSLIIAMTISETAIAKTTEPTAALEAEKITGTEDLIQVNENNLLENNLNSITLPDKNDKKIRIEDKEDNSELSIGVPNNINLSNLNLTDSGSYEYKNNGAVDLILQPTDPFCIYSQCVLLST